MKKTLISLSILSLVMLPSLALALDPSNFNNGTGSVNLGTAELLSTVVNVINWILGFLVLIAVIIILIGGFKWMTASGNEEKVGAARKTIISGIIGLIIVLAAYAIASFVINQFFALTT
jgi:hypothetical protein